MAYVQLASLVLFFLATFCMIQTKNVGAADCNRACSPFEMPPCGTRECKCIPFFAFPFVGACMINNAVDMKMIKENSNLCESHDDCANKGKGNFCGHYPNIEYGWCFASEFEAEDYFSKISSNDILTKDFLKNISSKSPEEISSKISSFLKNIGSKVEEDIFAKISSKDFLKNIATV